MYLKNFSSTILQAGRLQKEMMVLHLTELTSTLQKQMQTLGNQE